MIFAPSASPAPLPTETPSPTVIPSLTPTQVSVDTATPVPTEANADTETPVPIQTHTSTPTSSPTPIPVPSPPFTPAPTPSGPALIIGGVVFVAEVADTPSLRQTGLSGRDSLDPQTGMLFVFDSGRVTAFWMNEMRFPLDFVWIGDDCKVADTSHNVPNPTPDAPTSSLPIFRPSAPAAYNFEINAGEILQFGIEIGDEVKFLNIDSPNAWC